MEKTATKINLRFTYGTSRGRDTYGYAIVSLFADGNKVASCNGGGYDMQGTVFAEWLENNYQNRLLKLRPAYYWDEVTKKNTSMREKKGKFFYGLTIYTHGKDKTKAVLDGACGFDSMRSIAKAIGIELECIDYKSGVYQAIDNA